MPESDLRKPELRQEFRAAGGFRAFQFSLKKLFVLLTVIALILSVYCSVGPLVGTSLMELLPQRFWRFLIAVPTLLVWSVGLTIAIGRWKQDRVPAKLIVIALGGLILTSFVLQFVTVSFMFVAIPWFGQDGRDVNYWFLTFILVLRILLDTAFILVATFAQRPNDAPKIEQSDAHRDPFLTKEPYSP